MDFLSVLRAEKEFCHQADEGNMPKANMVKLMSLTPKM
jgi:hypothetical protein